MPTVRATLATLLFVVSAAAPVRAEVFLVDGPHGCLAIRGEWNDASSGCDVRHLVIPSEDRVVVASHVVFRTLEPAFNYGRLEVSGTFQPNGTLTNRGVMMTAGLTVNSGTIINQGTWVNRGWIHNHAGIGNEGVFENEGYFETCNGPLFNKAYMRNTGDIANWGSWIMNDGILVNQGTLYNPDADSYLVHNTGAIENEGPFENGGTLRVTCGGAFYGSGAFSGVPPAYDACNPALALQLLTTRVLDPAAFALGVPAKKDVRVLSASLARAAKDLAVNDRASAAGAVNAFALDAQVMVEGGRIARPLGAAYLGWAARLVVLLTD